MAQYLEYMLVQEGTSKSLEDAVNAHMKQGWQPLGGVTVVDESFKGAAGSFLQAMVREPKKETGVWPASAAVKSGLR
ncbi:MAG: DUF1737 domain-containing protein [Verrucomicrobia bacterium]|nr:DUF1737 domain-containing protein [Verrucomicrobiota bacterium]